jgi:hypothetical protein
MTSFLFLFGGAFGLCCLFSSTFARGVATALTTHAAGWETARRGYWRHWAPIIGRKEQAKAQAAMVKWG